MDDNQACVDFHAEQTIRTAAEAVQRLAEAINTHDRILINCDFVTSVDLSFIQVILSARKSARAKNKKIRLRNRANGPLLACLQSAGLLRGAIDGGEAADLQFWTNGADADVEDNPHG